MTYRYTIKYDHLGPLGIDSCTVGSPFKLLVRIYGPAGGEA